MEPVAVQQTKANRITYRFNPQFRLEDNVTRLRIIYSCMMLRAARLNAANILWLLLLNLGAWLSPVASASQNHSAVNSQLTVALSGMKLSGITLSGATLSGITLSEVTLSDANVSDAKPYPIETAPQPQRPTLHLGVYNFPPDFFATADNKQCGGPAFDQLKHVLHELGFHLKAVCIPPARLYKELADGNVDLIVNIKSTKALPTHLRVIEPPFSLLEMVLYQHKSRTQAPNNQSIAAIRAFDYHGKRAELMRQQFEFVDMPDATAAIDLFLHERTRYLLTYDGPFQARLAQLRQLPFQTLSPYVSHEIQSAQPFKRSSMLHIPTYVMISTLHPDATAIANALEKFAKRQRCNTLKNCPPQTAVAPQGATPPAKSL